MSKKRDPKDEAIAYVMNASLVEATTFVQTLAAVVKARAANAVKVNAAPAKPQAAKPRAPVRDIRLTDPNKPAEVAAQPSAEGGTQAPLQVS